MRSARRTWISSPSSSSESPSRRRVRRLSSASSRRIFSSRVPNSDSMPREIWTDDFIKKVVGADYRKWTGLWRKPVLKPQKSWRRENVSEVPFAEPTGAYAGSPFEFIIAIRRGGQGSAAWKGGGGLESPAPQRQK